MLVAICEAEGDNLETVGNVRDSVRVLKLGENEIVEEIAYDAVALRDSTRDADFEREADADDKREREKDNVWLGVGSKVRVGIVAVSVSTTTWRT